jgi:hypothetical protein
MDTFSNAIWKIEKEWLSVDTKSCGAPSIRAEALHPELTEHVTVALIDAGVDFMHKAISTNLVPGRSFSNHLDSPDSLEIPAPFHGSTTGHGTFMAYMIQRVCPSVKITVYKIDVLQKAKTTDPVTFTAKSAADVS